MDTEVALDTGPILCCAAGPIFITNSYLETCKERFPMVHRAQGGESSTQQQSLLTRWGLILAVIDEMNRPGIVGGHLV